MVNFDNFIESGFEYGVSFGDAVECGNHDEIGMIIDITEYDKYGEELRDEQFCGLCRESVYNSNHKCLDVSEIQSSNMELDQGYPFSIVDIATTAKIYKFKG